MDLIEEIKKLKALLDQGVITKVEFETLKTRLLLNDALRLTTLPPEKVQGNSNAKEGAIVDNEYASETKELSENKEDKTQSTIIEETLSSPKVSNNNDETETPSQRTTNHFAFVVVVALLFTLIVIFKLGFIAVLIPPAILIWQFGIRSKDYVGFSFFKPFIVYFTAIVIGIEAGNGLRSLFGLPYQGLEGMLEVLYILPSIIGLIALIISFRKLPKCSHCNKRFGLQLINQTGFTNSSFISKGNYNIYDKNGDKVFEYEAPTQYDTLIYDNHYICRFCNHKSILASGHVVSSSQL